MRLKVVRLSKQCTGYRFENVYQTDWYRGIDNYAQSRISLKRTFKVVQATTSSTFV